jgi:hypothetical protein
MNTIKLIAAATLMVLGAAASAAQGQDVNLYGSAPAHATSALPKAADRQAQADGVPSAKTAPMDVKEQADAEMAARDARAKGPRLEAKRQNLKGDAAAQSMRQQATPNSIDRATAYGDMERTEQTTNLLATRKKQ